MKAKDISVGCKYLMKVSGSVVPVQVVRIDVRYEPVRKREYTTYACTNLKTGRACSARSASKFRGPVPPELPTVRQATAMFDALDRKQEASQRLEQKLGELADEAHRNKITPEQHDVAHAEIIEQERETRKPVCQLSSQDGNVFAIIANVRKSLSRAGLDSRAEEFTQKAQASESYDAVLQLCFDYVDVR